MFRFISRLHSDRGFTLIELLVVVAITAILAAILTSNILTARAQSQMAASKGNLKNIATSLESFFATNAAYPDSASSLQPDYTGSLPKDPCTGVSFGMGGGYLYGTTGTPVTDYILRTNWSSTGRGKLCYAVNGNMNIRYTPGGGLESIP